MGGRKHSSFIKSLTLVSTLKPQNNKEVSIEQTSYWENKTLRILNGESGTLFAAVK